MSVFSPFATLPILPRLCAGFVVKIRGDNFGQLEDSQWWVDDMNELSVSIGGIPCTGAMRVKYRDNTQAIQCATGSGIVVGHLATNVSAHAHTHTLSDDYCTGTQVHSAHSSILE